MRPRSLGIGTPSFYHRASIEVGGSTPDRDFSYYVGIAGSNQAFNYVNNNNGSEYDNWLGPPLGLISGTNYAVPYAPGWSLYYGGTGNTYFPLGPAGNYSTFSTIYGRNVVMNFHIAIPHRYDGGRDDIQLLYNDESLKNQFYISGNDVASTYCTGALASSGTACMNAINGGPVTFDNTYTWSCPSAVGRTFSSTSINSLGHCVTPYGFPNGVNVGTPSNPNVIPSADRDNSYNDTAIVKLQYTKNIGSSAYFRVYGYTFYSDWFLNGAYSTNFCAFICPVAPDYELNSHTRGVSAQFQDQINGQNLLSVQGSYTTATIVRDNNGFYEQAYLPAAVIVSSAHPYNGLCYGQTTRGGAFGVVDCNATPYQASAPTTPRQALGALGLTDIGAAPSLTGLNCGGAPCEYMMAENGLAGTYSGTKPSFYSASVTDQYRPSDKWLINAGVRLDSYGFQGLDTLAPPLGGSAIARQFWFTAYNLDNCINNKTGAVSQNPAPGQVCPAGSHGAALQNISSQQFTYNIWQPRISGTYTSDPNNVLRFSYGRYTEAPNTAFEQYDTRQEDLADYLGTEFLQYGRNTPGYPIQPPTSINYDFSWEHHFKGSDLSFKITPFLRQTQNQIQQFFLNPIQGFVSGLNVGSQRSEGVEFQMQKGDFSRNGFSGLLSFAYTNSYVHYGPIAAGASGTTVLGTINNSIAQYNAYTKYCANHPSGNPNSICGGATSSGTTATACYRPNGTPVAGLPGGGCAPGDIANPYWNSAPQSLVNPSQAFPTFDTFPGALGLAAQGFGSPYVASMVLNYKHNQWAVTPSMQFQGGGKYGVPISEAGIDPAAGCGKPLVGDRYNASTCLGVVNIPDPFTGAFDGIGSFTQPNEFILNVQASYDISPRIQLVGVVANIVNYCWGGTSAPWTFNDGNICAYGNVAGTIYPVAPYGTPGATVNPPGYNGSIIQPFRKYPYEGTFGPALVSAENTSTKTPLQFYLTANIKL